MNNSLDLLDKLEQILLRLTNADSIVCVVSECLETGGTSAEICAYALHGADEYLQELANRVAVVIDEVRAAKAAARREQRRQDAMESAPPNDLAQILLDALAEQEGGGGHDG